MITILKQSRRMRRRVQHSAVLASGPFVLALACSVYNDSSLGPSDAPGGSSSAGKGSTGSSDSGAGNGKAGSAAGAMSAGGLAGGGATASSAGSAMGGISGGNGGSAADAGAAGAPMLGELGIIDDMEDADGQVALTAGRNGYWYVGNDGTVGATQDPKQGAFDMFELPEGERDGSSFASRMKVDGFTDWGSVIGFNVVQVQAVVKPYDASAYCGVRFWAKAAATTPVRFRLPDGDTHPAGKVCVETGPSDQLCYDHFSAAVSFTTEWQPISLMFADLEQVGTGYHPPDMAFKADEIYSFEWALPGTGKTYEIWLDDVAFLNCK